MAARKDDAQDVEEEVEEGQGYEEEQGTSINITQETITIEVPRDGSEGDTLGRLAKLVDGLGG